MSSLFESHECISWLEVVKHLAYLYLYVSYLIINSAENLAILYLKPDIISQLSLGYNLT